MLKSLVYSQTVKISLSKNSVNPFVLTVVVTSEVVDCLTTNMGGFTTE